MKTSERCSLMQENFIKLHNEGYSISEIAEKFDLSIWSIYYNLQKIADANGVSRESLLTYVHKAHVKSSTSTVVDDNIDPQLLMEDFDEMSSHLKSIIGTIDTILNENEQEEK